MFRFRPLDPNSDICWVSVVPRQKQKASALPTQRPVAQIHRASFRFASAGRNRLSAYVHLQYRARAHLLSRALFSCQTAALSRANPLTHGWLHGCVGEEQTTGYNVFMAVAALGSTLMPGPMLLQTVTFFMKVPFTAGGRALTMASITADMFSNKLSVAKLAFPIGT